MPAVQETVDQVRRIDVDQYKYGFETQIESDKVAPGLNEDVIRLISAQAPKFAGVDPYNKLIDRNSDDNVAPVLAARG